MKQHLRMYSWSSVQEENINYWQGVCGPRVGHPEPYIFSFSQSNLCVLGSNTVSTCRWSRFELVTFFIFSIWVFHLCPPSTFFSKISL